MPTCFVSLTYLYSVGFDRLDELPKETLNRFYEIRENEVERMMEIQFILSYLGNISKKDSDDMTPFELDNWVRLLKKQKDLENKQENRK